MALNQQERDRFVDAEVGRLVSKLVRDGAGPGEILNDFIRHACRAILAFVPTEYEANQERWNAVALSMLETTLSKEYNALAAAEGRPSLSIHYLSNLESAQMVRRGLNSGDSAFTNFVSDRLRKALDSSDKAPDGGSSDSFLFVLLEDLLMEGALDSDLLTDFRFKLLMDVAQAAGGF